MTTTETVTPNPPSPFANADPDHRHILGFFAFLGVPEPGTLAPTLCDRITVTPTEALRYVSDENGTIPNGLCPNCTQALATFRHGMPDRPTVDCRFCGELTPDEGVCGACRKAMHTAWAAAGLPMDGSLRALTVKQPWADAIVHTIHPVWGPKRIENRTWLAPEAQIWSRILIHAGKTADRAALAAGVLPGPDARGAVIGTAVLAGCHLQSAGYCALKECGPWAEQEVFHWRLDDVQPLPRPVEAKGALQLWRPAEDLVFSIAAALAGIGPYSAPAEAADGTDNQQEVSA